MEYGEERHDRPRKVLPETFVIGAHSAFEK
jgi:hypothetical protein